MVNIVTSPLRPVEFRDFFLADQLISIAIVLYDLEYTICFLSFDAWHDTDHCSKLNKYIQPFIALLPAMWRFLQCLRRYRDTKDVWQVYNAGKYSTGFFVIMLSSLRSAGYPSATFFWGLAVVISTCYTFFWDMKKDWGLLDKEHGYLREQLLYPRKVYYICGLLNLIMRLMWTLTISPAALGVGGYLDPLIFATILAGVEIVRRAQWNIFRLENEHLNNCGNYRATKDIPVPLVLPSEDE